MSLSPVVCAVIFKHYPALFAVFAEQHAAAERPLEPPCHLCRVVHPYSAVVLSLGLGRAHEAFCKLLCAPHGETVLHDLPCGVYLQLLGLDRDKCPCVTG